jgi:hypothetical protein
MPRNMLMDCLGEAAMDNVLHLSLFWLNWGTLDYETACFAWNEL